MRNWNGDLVRVIDREFNRFQRTYEELKPKKTESMKEAV